MTYLEHQTSTAESKVEPFIDKRETAKRLGCGLRTIDSWMKRGILPFYKISRKISFRWSEVEVALRQKCHVNRGGFNV
jgi:excisionase family DNA binding protein